MGQTSTPAVSNVNKKVAYATYAPKPEYSYYARSHHIEGKGVFQLNVRADGTVSSVDTVQSTGHSELDDSARSTFLKWRFRPGTVSMARIPIAFSLFHGGFPRLPLPPPPNRGKVREVHDL